LLRRLGPVSHKNHLLELSSNIWTNLPGAMAERRPRAGWLVFRHPLAGGSAGLGHVAEVVVTPTETVRIHLPFLPGRPLGGLRCHGHVTKGRPQASCHHQRISRHSSHHVMRLLGVVRPQLISLLGQQPPIRVVNVGQKDRSFPSAGYRGLAAGPPQNPSPGKVNR
jgi:hypothetical protein